MQPSEGMITCKVTPGTARTILIQYLRQRRVPTGLSETARAATLKTLTEQFPQWTAAKAAFSAR
jgi:hypothetical protein